MLLASSSSYLKSPLEWHFVNTNGLIAKLLMVGMVLLGSSQLKAEDYYYVPNEIIQETSTQIILEYQGKELSFDTLSNRWLPPYNELAPLTQYDGKYYSSYQSLRTLGLLLPRLRRIRTSDNGHNSRIVFEIESSAGLQTFRSEGVLATDAPLRINLPALFIPLELHQKIAQEIAPQIGDISLETTYQGTILEIDPIIEKTLNFGIFSLQNPMRLVVDLEHEGDLNLVTSFERTHHTTTPTEDTSTTATEQNLPAPTTSTASEIATPDNTTPTPSTSSLGTTAEDSSLIRNIASSQPSETSEAYTTNQAPQPLPQASQTPPPPRTLNPFEPITAAPPASTPSVDSGTVEEVNRYLRRGIRYKRFNFATSQGSSGVHLLEISPNLGQFQVVGQSGTPQTISQLADGAFAAINASYFNTQSFVTIGLLKTDEGLSSLPSRGRAAIAFENSKRPFIGRIVKDVELWYGNRRIPLENYNTTGDFFVYDRTGESVGSAEQQVILVQDNHVLEIGSGPLIVPSAGFAIVYAPSMQNRRTYSKLQRAQIGDSIRLDITYRPNTFNNFRYGVEAGPLLVANGRSALRPELEAFSRGQRILDGRTQQAAIGIKADGTMLLLTADAMIAEELIPLFLSLGASDAMRLDSGSSASLFVNGELMNRSNERAIVSAITYTPY